MERTETRTQATVALPTHAHPRVSVIIPTANVAPALLESCLRALAGQEGVPFETVIVLNDATEKLAAFVRERVTGARVIPSPVNRGFAGGANRGAREARAPLLLFTHDDAALEQGALATLVSALDEDPALWAVGSADLDRDGVLRSLGGIIFRGASGAPAWHRDPPERAVLPVDAVGTIGLLIHRDRFEAIGGFDVGFYPAYFGEYDLALRIRSAGGVVAAVSGSRVRHTKGSSVRLPFAQCIAERNKARFLSRWGPALAARPAFSEDPAVRERERGRMAAEAETIRRGGRGPAPEPLPPVESDESDDAYRRRETAVLKDYVAWLEAEYARVCEAHEAQRRHSLGLETALRAKGSP